MGAAIGQGASQHFVVVYTQIGGICGSQLFPVHIAHRLVR